MKFIQMLSSYTVIVYAMVLFFPMDSSAMLVSSKRAVARKPTYASVSKEERSASLKRQAEFRKNIPSVVNQFKKREEQARKRAKERHLKEEELANTLRLNPLGLQGKRLVKWVKTEDAIVPVDMINAREMQVLLTAKGDTKENPIDLSGGKDAISSFELTLLSHAYDALANGTFDKYYDNLLFENYEYTEGKYWGESRLHLLTDAARRVQAKVLLSLLAAKKFPPDIQQFVTPDIFKDSVCAYLKKQLLKNDFSYGVVPEKYVSPQFEVTCFSFNGDATQCLIGGDSGRLELIGVKNKNEKIFEGHTKGLRLFRAEFNESEDRIVSYATSREIGRVSGFNEVRGPVVDEVIIWDAETGKKIHRLEIDSPLGAITFDKKNNKVVVGFESTVKIFDMISGSSVSEFLVEGGGSIINSVYCHPGGRFIAVGGKTTSNGKPFLVIVDSKFESRYKFSDCIEFAFDSAGRILFLIQAQGFGLPRLLEVYDISSSNDEIADSLMVQKKGSFSGERYGYMHNYSFTGIKCSSDGSRCFVSDEKTGEKFFFKFENELLSRSDVSFFKDKNLVGDYEDFMFCPDNRIFWPVIKNVGPDFSRIKRLDRILLFDIDAKRVIKIQFNALSSAIKDFRIEFDKKGKSVFVRGRMGGLNQLMGIYKIPFFSEDMLIDRMKKSNLTAYQWILLYRLYLAREKNLTLTPEFKKLAMKEFEGLSKDIKDVIKQFFLPEVKPVSLLQPIKQPGIREALKQKLLNTVKDE